MKNLSRNTAAVLVLTLFTGLAVFSAIQLGGRLFGTPTASPQTTAAESAQGQGSASGSGYGQSGNGYGQGESGYGNDQGGGYADPYGAGGQGSSDPYGQSGSSSGDSNGGQTYTCPATGCTASSCHATEQ